MPTGTNLYGAHPIYIEHRGANGSHGVVLVNSNGMDVKINNTDGQYLEYNILGGVFEFYFVAGPTPVETAQQISQVVGKPAMIPYAGLGFHNCRYGYQDIYQVAEVVYNYSSADIPLETMWTDIDYMVGSSRALPRKTSSQSYRTTLLTLAGSAPSFHPRCREISS